MKEGLLGKLYCHMAIRVIDNVSTIQRTEARKVEKGFPGLSGDTYKLLQDMKIIQRW